MERAAPLRSSGPVSGRFHEEDGFDGGESRYRTEIRRSDTTNGGNGGPVNNRGDTPGAIPESCHKYLTFVKGDDLLVYAMTSKKPFPEAPDDSPLHKVRPGEYGNLLKRVQAIAKSLNIPVPDVWVADSKSVQAEAFPSNNVAITSATLKLLTDREQNAILGHELGHRKNGDKDGLSGSLQVLGEVFKGHLQEHRESLADQRAVEAAFATHLYRPDDLSSALAKMVAAGKTAGHDISAMNGSLAARANGAMMAALPEGVAQQVNSIGDRWNSFWAGLHLNTHPSLEHRIENINELKQAHDRAIKR